jgi:hypothetical protein
MVRWLEEQGLEASAFATEYGDSDDDEPASSGAAVVADDASSGESG